MDGVLYIIAQASYIYIYISQEIQPAIFARESSMQLIKYLLDVCIRYSLHTDPFSSLRKVPSRLIFNSTHHRIYLQHTAPSKSLRHMYLGFTVATGC